MAKSFCVACGATFKSAAGFDKHRIGSWGEAIYRDNDTRQKNPVGYTHHSRRCMTEEEMRAVGMSLNAHGWWITSAYEPGAHADDENEE